MSSDDPVGQLAPQDWLSHPATQQVVAALSAQGGEVRFVGGCVRDGLLGRPVQDVDLATPYTPETVMALLAERQIKVVPTGIAHGTVTAHHLGRSFEITTLRRDVETDGRHARVAFTHSWREDAARRKLAHRLAELSPERISNELYKLLTADDPSPVVTVMCADGIFDAIIPEIQRPDRLKILVWLETHALARPNIGPDWVRRLASLLPPDRTIARAVGVRLRLSKAQTERLGAIAAGWPRATPDSLDRRELRRLLHRLGPNLVRDRVLVAWAELRRIDAVISSAVTARWVALLDQTDQWQPVVFPLRGQDALDMGCPPGPALGHLLEQVELWWEDQDYQPNHQECLAKLHMILAARPI